MWEVSFEDNRPAALVEASDILQLFSLPKAGDRVRFQSFFTGPRRTDRTNTEEIREGTLIERKEDHNYKWEVLFDGNSQAVSVKASDILELLQRCDGWYVEFDHDNKEKWVETNKIFTEFSLTPNPPREISEIYKRLELLIDNIPVPEVEIPAFQEIAKIQELLLEISGEKYSQDLLAEIKSYGTGTTDAQKKIVVAVMLLTEKFVPGKLPRRDAAMKKDAKLRPFAGIPWKQCQKYMGDYHKHMENYVVHNVRAKQRNRARIFYRDNIAIFTERINMDGTKAGVLQPLASWVKSVIELIERDNNFRNRLTGEKEQTTCVSPHCCRLSVKDLFQRKPKGRAYRNDRYSLEQLRADAEQHHQSGLFAKKSPNLDRKDGWWNRLSPKQLWTAMRQHYLEFHKCLKCDNSGKQLEGKHKGKDCKKCIWRGAKYFTGTTKTIWSGPSGNAGGYFPEIFE